MRKFLSVIMVVAMLVTSILPAIANVAAADGAFTYNVSTDGFVDNGDGTATAKVDFEITNNPGGVDALNIVLYYTNGEIETGDYVYPEVYADYSDGTDNKVSTNRNLKSYFAYAGISTASDLYGTSFEVILEGDGTIDDEGVYATFDVIALDADAVASGAEYTYGFIVQALDVDGEEIAVDPVYTEYKLAAKPADPYATTHDVETFPEDQFTINLTGAHVYENAFVEGEIPTADVNVEFHGNTEANNPFGVWGFRCFVTYPAELTAVGYTNGDIFKDAEMMKFEDCATNLDVTAELEKDEVVRIVQDAVKGFEYVGYETYATDGIKVSVIQYLGTNWYDVTYGDGLVQTITFQLPEDAAAGDRWDIGICANGTGDVCHNGGSTPDDQHPDLEPAPIAAAYNNGYIEVVSVKEETFEDFTFSTEDITVSADRETVDVKINVSGNTAEVNPYGFWGARLFVYYPADLAITNIAQGAIVPEGGFTLGRYNVNLPELIEAEPTNQVATAAPLAFADKGFDWENEDFRVTCIYFQAPTDADCIVKNGHYATITFELPEGAVAGDSWYVNIATCYNNADVNGYKADPSLSTSIVEKLTHALDDGSITIGGDAVVEPEPPAAHEHVLEYTAAVEAGCHYTGNTEYWYCAGCDTVFADAEATQITNRKNVIIPAKGSNLLVHMDAVEAGCHYDGNVEYWICYECEQVWADEALTQLTNIKNVVLPAVGSENLHHVDYLAPTYEANGNIEYWYCDDCGQVWQDEALTQLTNRMNVIIPMLTKATVVVGTDTVVKGEEANVAITLDNNPGLFIGKFVITYDASVLTLVEATNGDLFADDNVIITAEEGKITLYFENNVVADVVANGVLANLVFATDAEGEPAEVALEIVADAENNINVAGEDVAIDVVAGKVNVINCAHEGTTLTPNQVKAPTVYEEGIMEYICECGEVAYTEAIAKLAGFEFGSAEMTAGDTVASSFIVSLLNNPGVWSFSATFAYDANVLEFVSVDAFENMLFTVDEYSYSVADGVITVYFESTDLNNIEGDGHAFMLAFSAISCGYSDIDAELVADNTINAAGENVAFEAIDGYVFAKCALTHVDYVAPTATEGGMQEYWYCEYCGAVYADAEGRYITNRMNLYIPPVAIQLDSWIEVNEGEQAKVAVDLVSNPGVWSLGLKVAYDADNLAFAGIESGLFEIDDNSYSVADGVITIFVENAEIADIVENGTAFTLVFDTVVGGYYDIDAELVAENTINAASENVEFGVNDGAITVIHVCDLEYFAAVEASCHQNGMLEYWYCEACDSVYADAEGTIVTNRKNLTVPYTAEIVHVEAVEPGCHYDGNVEYWYCADCQAVFTDAALTQLSNFKNVIVPATGSENLVHFDAVEAGCHYTGNIEYWFCPDCEQYWQDEALTQLTNSKNVIIPAKGSDLFVHMDAVEPGCHYDGNVEYWICYECEQVWADEALTQLTNIKNVVVPAIGSENLQHVEAVAPTCNTEGNIEYWYCPDCECYWQDEALTQLTNAKNVILGTTEHNIIHFDAVEPGCHYNGNIEYWFCSICEGFWADEALTMVTNSKSVILPATGAEVTHVAAVEASCHQNGNIEYWYCESCEQVWQDEALTQLTNIKNVVVPATAEIIYVEAVEPTCCQTGNYEYWYCSECDAVFADAALTQLTNRRNLTIAATAEIIYVEAVEASCHQNGSAAYYYCSECDAVYDEDFRLTNRKNLTIPYTAEIIYVEAVEPTCCQTGNYEYWYCSECDAVFADAALTQLTNRRNLTIAATAEIIYVEAVEASCHQNGSAAYYYCSECDAVYDEDFILTNRKNLTIPYTAEIIHVDAVEATCHQNGNVEYWYCSECDAVFTDAALTQLSNFKNVVVPATAEIIYVEAVEPTCCQTGNYEYWYCSECDAVFADAALTQLTNRRNLTIAATAEIIYVEAVEATCHQNGSAAYYYCSECDAVYDEDFILTNRKNLTIPYTAEIIYVEAVEPTCCQTGNYEYWYCSECDAVFADAALTQLTNRRNLTIAATAEIIYVEAVEASCHQNGSAAYYYCSECDAVYDEDFILTNRKNLTIPYTAEIIHVDAVEAVCHQTGNVEYWYCSECDAVFTDAALTQLSNFKSVITPAPVALTYVEAVAATCTDDGNVEYWYCSECDAVFADAMGAVITNYKNVVVPALGHVAGDKVVTVEPTETTEGAWEIRCTVCGELLESGTIAKTAFITKASGTDYVKSVVLEGDVITVVARPNAPYVKVAVGYDKGIEIASDNLTIFYYTYSYLNINNGESATIIATNADGDTKEYTVVVEWTNEAYTSYVGGYTTTDVQVSDETFNVYVKPNMNNASIGFVVTEGTTYVADEGLEVVLSGGKVYFKALESAADDSYTVVFTTRAGVEVVVTINFIFDYAEVSGAQGGGMVDGLELASGNVINITVNDKYAYASFRFVLKNTTSSIIAEEGVDVVLDRGISWFKIYNDGTDAVTKTFVVTNNANGVVDTYTVNVAFGSDN